MCIPCRGVEEQQRSLVPAGTRIGVLQHLPCTAALLPYRTAAIRPALTINAPSGKSPRVQAASVALLLVALEHWMAARTVGVPDLARHLHQCSPFKELSALAASDSVGR